ncbi:hypothetical protein H4R27_006276 [Coemansia aciculifera]|nr:hypothetical protein H4R27_006276 [Coemansia aciculifera]
MSVDMFFYKYKDQVANYAWRVWKNQTRRTFVPVLFLIKCYLSLVVFTRAAYYKAPIGPVMYANAGSKETDNFSAAVALRDLCFLLTLPADRFGLFDASPFPFKCLYIDPHAQLAALKVVKDESAANVTVGDPIEQRIPLTGRCAHLYRVRYGDKDAILKLSWTRTNRLPEGAVYEVLGTKGDDGSPCVSGIDWGYVKLHGQLNKPLDTVTIMYLKGEQFIYDFKQWGIYLTMAKWRKKRVRRLKRKRRKMRARNK